MKKARLSVSQIFVTVTKSFFACCLRELFWETHQVRRWAPGGRSCRGSCSGVPAWASCPAAPEGRPCRTASPTARRPARRTPPCSRGTRWARGIWSTSNPIDSLDAIVQLSIGRAAAPLSWDLLFWACALRTAACRHLLSFWTNRWNFPRGPPCVAWLTISGVTTSHTST